MKKDIDSLLHQNHLAGILVLGNGDHNAAMMYLTGGGHFTNAILIKKVDEEPVLVVNPMEREEAARTGLKVLTMNDFRYFELVKQAGDHYSLAEAMLYQRVLEEFGLVSGDAVLYGQVEAGSNWETLSYLKEHLPALHLVSDSRYPVLSLAMATKEPAEIERIRRMGEITTRVVGRVAAYIQSGHIRDEVLMGENSEPVTIADIKSRIDLWLAELGAENPEGTIFSIGHDAGVPHSVGLPTDVLKTGLPIVFDIYPCEKGGGYFYDFTRTWCIGYAPKPVRALYEQVHTVYEQVVSELKVNTTGRVYQQRTCELFEAMGHPTVLKVPDTVNGYNHSIGHGVGLQVHERPWLSAHATGNNLLEPGMVFTMEPGLYYPDQGMGVRIEDTFYIDAHGNVKRCVEYPYELVLTVKG